MPRALLRVVVVLVAASVFGAPALAAPVLLPVRGPLQTYKEFNGFAGRDQLVIYTVPAGKTLYVTDIVLNQPTATNAGPSGPTALAILTRLRPGETPSPLSFAAVVRLLVPAGQNVIFSPRTAIEFNAGDTFRICSGGSTSGTPFAFHIFGYER